ncbi:MAG: hypothetical protein WDZ38_00110 [Balneolaceae bacterium]
MNRIVKNIPVTMRMSTLVFALLNFTIAYLLSGEEFYAWLLGYSLGLFAVFIHFFTSLITNSKEGTKFLKMYYLSLVIRFLIVITIFIAIMTMIKIDEFSFTVSFIISYIFHSVIEVIFLNQKL